MPDDWRPSGAGDRDIHGVCCYFDGCRIGRRGNATHDRREYELEDFTRQYIEKSGLQERIVFHVGDACKIIPTLDEMFDLVFIDADKREYSEYYRLVFDKVRVEE